MNKLRVFSLLLAAFLLLYPASVQAHELGVVQTYATFEKAGTYQIDLVFDEEHLPPGKTGGPAGETRYGPIQGLAGDLDRRLGRFLHDLVDGAAPAFDGKAVTPRAAIATRPDDPTGRVVVRLSGAIPGGARSFTWSNSLAVGSSPLILKNEGDEGTVWRWLEPGETSPPFALADAVVPPTRAEVARLYLGLGFTHILPKGLDHILFVLGIYLLSRRVKPVLLQATAFTVAHTLTLALTLYGVISLSPAIVEPLIALSIVYVAVENVLTPELRPSRLALVFAFGLLHGMGFAGVLAELGLPRSEFLTALVSFNVGVEAGQLAVIALAFLAIGLPFSDRAWYRRRVVVPLSCLIAAVGLYWSIQRVFF
ncbi:MAG TPA: HupE/UreJ family protein [Thermoanaerobaculia bacterium]|nr:HupE/UreJ family protein [Thermoanaerobaculia bacterium]